MKHNSSFTNWIERNWHPLCGMAYLIICILDFAVMPLLYEVENYQLSATKIVELAIQFKDGPAQVAALTLLHSQHTWMPITLSQNGFFHVAFGAILGVGVWSKNRSQGSNDSINNLVSEIQNLTSNMSANTTTTTVGSTVVTTMGTNPTNTITNVVSNVVTTQGTKT